MLSRLRSMRDSVGFMKRLFAVAEHKADRDGEPAPGPEHLLLAAVDLDDGVAREVLGEAGVAAEDLADAVARARGSIQRMTPTRRSGMPVCSL